MSKFSTKKPSKARSWTRVWQLVAVIVVALGLLGAFGVQYFYRQNLKPVSASQRQVQVTIASGSSANDIAKTLHDKGVIKAPWAFEWYVRTNSLRDRLQAGTYSLRPSQTVEEIANALTNGKVDTSLVTILPGQRLDQIRSSLINNAGFAEADVDKALDPSLYMDHPALADKPVDATLEGYLYPDSFQKVSTTTPQTIIRASLDEMQKRLTPDIRTAFVRQGLTVHEGVILASIIEQEAGNAADKPTIAQVFLSRYRQGMMLGSDVTAFYGAVIADQEPTVFYDSPYNTRIHTGLPPGPISNVSSSSLEAVAKPASTDYLFFVAGDDGMTYFSHTNEEHEALTKEHCKKLCSQ